MQIRSSRLIYSGIVLLFLLLTAGISSADEVNVGFVSRFGGVISDVSVDGNHAYIGQGKDLVILDLTDVSKPSEIARLMTTSVVYDVVVAGNNAYITNAEGDLLIANISNPAAPTLTGSYDINGYAEDVSVSGNYAYVTNNLYDHGYYGQLEIIDISNASAPKLTESYDTVCWTHGVATSGNYVYVANGDCGLLILDITNPSSPIFAGSYDTVNAFEVAVAGTYAYVGDENGLEILDVTNPAKPNLVGSYGTSGYPSGVAVASNYVYIVDENGLSIVDATDPATPNLVGSYSTFDAADIAVSGNYAYVADANGLLILDIITPSSPKLESTYDVACDTSDIAVLGNYAYVADGINGLEIFDITDLYSPELVGRCETNGSALRVTVSGNYAYITTFKDADNHYSLVIADVSDPSLPSIVGKYDDNDAVLMNIDVSGSYAYVTDGYNNLSIINISSPSSPTLEGIYETEGSTLDVAVSDKYAYVIVYDISNPDLDSLSDLLVLDITNPSSPKYTGHYGFRNNDEDMVEVGVAGNYVYVSIASQIIGNGHLDILDVSIPSSPKEIASYERDVGDFAIAGDYIYIGCDNGLSIVDISDHSSPTIAAKYDLGGWANNVEVSANYVYVSDSNQALTILRVETASDTTPPVSVTNLKENDVGPSWINWTWTNPTDSDFSHLIVYLNGSFVTNTSGNSINSYNATGLTEGLTYTISTHTVDISGNINSTWVNDSATTTIPADTTPPASVTDLGETGAGTSWINWTWANPNDADFKHVMIYLNGSFVTNTSDNSINSYNATGLAEGATYTIGTHTVDTSGNINSTWVNDSATAVKLPNISNVSGTNITTSSITLVWEASNDTTKVEIRRDDMILGNVSGATTYVDSNLSSGTTYNYTLIPYNVNGLEGKAVSISLKTASPGSGGGSSSKKSSSSGGGGGGTGSAEDFANVALKDADSEYLRMNANVTYKFTKEGNPIQAVTFYSLKNSGQITSTIEGLHNRSKLVKTSPEGLVYKYVNIWVGKSGFATAANIKDAKVRFKVTSSWLQEMGVSPADVKLQRYNGDAWEVLPTTLVGDTTDYAIFESQTPGFSPFAITAEKAVVTSVADETVKTPSRPEDVGVKATQPEKTPGFGFSTAILIIGIIAVGYVYLKRRQN
jgi:PGF-pre-PGF domain-containing protein